MGYILHLSDFHFTENYDSEKSNLDSMTEFLRDEKYIIDYLVFTGDLVDARYLSNCAAEKTIHHFYNLIDQKVAATKAGLDKAIKELSEEHEEQQNSLKEYYDDALIETLTGKVKTIAIFIKELCWKLNIGRDSLILCCGNHDSFRFLSKKYDGKTVLCEILTDSSELSSTHFSAFNEFCSALELEYNSMPALLLRHNAAFLIWNTNYAPQPGKTQKGACVDCEQMKELFRCADTLDVPLFCVSHKPENEFCEYFQYPYPENQKVPAKHDMPNYRYWLCGDKHTDEVNHTTGESIAGAPLSGKDSNGIVTYSLLDYQKNQPLVMRLKCRVSQNGNTGTWWLEAPEEIIASHIRSEHYLTESSKLFLKKYESNLSFDSATWTKFSNLFRVFIKYRNGGKKEKSYKFGEGDNIFHKVLERIQSSSDGESNPLNIRGQIGSGKSTFMGMLYQYLWAGYQSGQFDMLPAYFNVREVELKLNRNEESNVEAILNAIERDFCDENDTSEALLNSISFLPLHQRIASKKLKICYLIDGLDEVDHIGEIAGKNLASDVVNRLKAEVGSKYILAWSKNDDQGRMVQLRTGSSDVLFFNEIDTFGSFRSNTLEKFIQEYCNLMESNADEQVIQQITERISSNIQNLEIPKINLHYLHELYDFLKKDIDRYPKNIFNEFYTSLSERNEIKDWKSRGIERIMQEACYSMTYLNNDFATLIQSGKKIPFSDFQKLRVSKLLQNYLLAQYYSDEYRRAVKTDDSILQEFVPRTMALFLRAYFTSQTQLLSRTRKMISEYREYQRKSAGELSIWACSAITAYFAGCCNGSGEERKRVLNGISAINGMVEFWKAKYDIVLNLLNNLIASWKEDSSSISFNRLSALRSLFIAKIVLFHYSENPRSDKKESQAACELFLKLFIENVGFRDFNRVIQRAYYGDIGISKLYNVWIDEIAPSGFDFNYTYGILSRRIKTMIESETTATVNNLGIIDLLTICDLTESRLSMDYSFFGLKHFRNDTLAKAKKEEKTLEEKMLEEIQNLICGYKAIYRTKLEVNLSNESYTEFDQYLDAISESIMKRQNEMERCRLEMQQSNLNTADK